MLFFKLDFLDENLIRMLSVKRNLQSQINMRYSNLAMELD